MPIERSSHAISIIGETLYLFGGENVARVPIDSSIYAVNISPNASNFGIWKKLDVKNDAPVPRIAHSQATIGNKIYIFGGRQGRHELTFIYNETATAMTKKIQTPIT